MASIATADLTIRPKFDGLQRQIRKTLKEVEEDYSASGRKSGAGFGRGLGSSGASIGVFSTLASRAMDSISSHIGGAVARLDTLKNYPMVMQSLGYSSRDADASIGKMSDRLSSLPTRLDDMASTVQGLAVITGDLDKATDAGLALNDMLLASGSSTQITSAAMEQFRQMLSKGKPEMQDWKSLMSAMPGQMDQLAKSMLGPTAGADDLYAALGGGKAKATISMDQLLNEIIRLDERGGEGFDSFRKQAEAATGGVGTSMANLSNAVTKGLAGTMDAIGRENIAEAFGGIRAAVDEVFKTANAAISKVMPVLSGIARHVSGLVPSVLRVTAVIAGFKKAGDLMSKFDLTVSGVTRRFGELSKKGGDLLKSIDPVTAALTVAVTVGGLLATAWAEARERAENLDRATRGLAEAVSDTAGLSGYAATVEAVVQGAKPAALGVDELAESTSRHVEAMQRNTAAAQEQIAQLNTAQRVIGECAGKTELSAEQQGKLEWALRTLNAELGTSITKTDVMADSYLDADGNVVSLSESIGQLIERKKEEARASALSENLTEAYKAQSDAAATLAEQQQLYNNQVDYWAQKFPDLTREQIESQKVGQKLKDDLASATEQYDAAAQAVSGLESQLGMQAQAAASAASEMEAFCAGAGPVFEQTLLNNKTSAAALAQSLSELGVRTDDLAALNEADLLRIAQSYDGTTGSVVGRLGELGVAMGNTEAATQASAQYMVAAMQGMGGGFAESLAGMGYDLSALGGKLGEAGVSTSQLNRIGSANLLELARSCGGSMDAMVGAIQNYNAVGIDGKFATAEVEHGSLTSANSGIVEFRRQPRDLGTKTGHVNIFQQIWQTITGQHASGGIRPHADGGIAVRPRMHAGGAIAVRAVPLDIVGEDGAEAIVPLTNRRYSQPFADIIAERVAERSGGGPTASEITEAVLRALRGVGGFRLEMDAESMALRLAPAMDRQLGYRTEMGY